MAKNNSDLKAKTAQTKLQTSGSNNIPTLKDSDSEKSSDDDKAVSSKAGMTFYKPFPRKKGKKAISGEEVPWPHEFAQNETVNYNDKEFGILQLDNYTYLIYYIWQKNFL